MSQAGDAITDDTRSEIAAHPEGAVLQTGSRGLILTGDNRLQGFTTRCFSKLKSGLRP